MIHAKMKEEDKETVFAMIQPKLKDTFPFMERNLEFAIEPKENLYWITFADFFMIGPANADQTLIGSVPA